MNTEAQHAALNATARQCNAKLKQLKSEDKAVITEVFNSFKSTVELLGFTIMELKVQIGRINGKLTDRRLD